MANHPLLKVAGFQVITPGWFWVIADIAQAHFMRIALSHKD